MPSRKRANPAKGHSKRARPGCASPNQHEQSLRHLDRLAGIGLMTASLGHEIKNALVASKTLIDLLLERNQDAQLAGLVRREVGRIEALVSRMLAYSANNHASFSPIRVHDVLDHSLQLVQPHLRAKAISLHRAFASPSDRVKGDTTSLQQAFVNLLLNASEAMGQNGKLTVGTELLAQRQSRHKPRLCVAIRDTGEGIAPGDIPRLFKPFFTTKQGGTGLGLSITRRIIEEHGGALAVESQPGQGATFRVLLPALG